MTPVVPVSVIIPTIGRGELLRACLESLAACNPRADEVIVVVQGPPDRVAELVARFAESGARSVPCSGRGKSLALNVGLREAKNDLVLITDDDCRVSPSWVGLAQARLNGDPDTILTGRVLAAGDPEMVPATSDDRVARDHIGPRAWSTLLAGNMAFHRDAVRALGGFAEELRVSAEEEELAYRWVQGGKRIRYDPDLVVWHSAWRTPLEVAARYVDYARGQGKFYGMHIRRGELRLIGSVAAYLYAGVRGLAEGIVHRRPAWSDHRRGILPGLLPGLLEGLRESKPRKDRRLRRVVRGVRPLQSTRHLLRAAQAAVEVGPKRTRRRVDSEVVAPLQYQIDVLDRARAGHLFGETLEIGCAEGYFTEMLADRCEGLLAVDLYPAALARARQRRDWDDHVRFAQLDMRTDPLPGPFDLIVIAGVLENVDRPSALWAARQKLVAALRPGGQLFVVTTRDPVAENAWWGRIRPRGTRINDFIAAHPSLRALISEQADWYVLDLFERAR